MNKLVKFVLFLTAFVISKIYSVKIPILFYSANPSWIRFPKWLKEPPEMEYG